MGCACSKVKPVDATPTCAGTKFERHGSNMHNNKLPKDHCIAAGVIAGLPSKTGPETLQSEGKSSGTHVVNSSVHKQPESRQQSAEVLPKHLKSLRHGASKQIRVCQSTLICLSYTMNGIKCNDF